MTQRLTAILILLIFSVSEFKPLIHLVDYAVNYEYISTELCVEKDEPESCCKGKCYLSDQLASAVDSKDDSSSERKAPKIEWEKAPMLLFPSEKTALFLSEEQIKAPTIGKESFFDDISLKIPSPPPRS